LLFLIRRYEAMFPGGATTARTVSQLSVATIGFAPEALALQINL
jgi:hypothetical protein